MKTCSLSIRIASFFICILTFLFQSEASATLSGRKIGLDTEPESTEGFTSLKGHGRSTPPIEPATAPTAKDSPTASASAHSIWFATPIAAQRNASRPDAVSTSECSATPICPAPSRNTISTRIQLKTDRSTTQQPDGKTSREASMPPSATTMDKHRISEAPNRPNSKRTTGSKSSVQIRSTSAPGPALQQTSSQPFRETKSLRSNLILTTESTPPATTGGMSKPIRKAQKDGSPNTTSKKPRPRLKPTN